MEVPDSFLEALPGDVRQIHPGVNISMRHLLNVRGSVIGMVFPEDRKRCKHRSCAFWVIVFDHDTPWDMFSRSSKLDSIRSRTEDFRGIKKLKQLWSTDKFVTRESSVRVL